MFDCHRVRHTNSHGYTGCRRHGVNPAVQPAAQDHNCDFDHKGKGREILAKNNPNISIKGHESWSARRLKTTDFYWIRLKSWTNVSYICIIYIYMVIDLKVLVRILNCESRACYVGNPRESFFFRVRESNIFFHKRCCWPTWAPRKINMEFAKVSRK